MDRKWLFASMPPTSVGRTCSTSGDLPSVYDSKQWQWPTGKQGRARAVYGEAAREESLWMRPDAVAFRRWCLEGSWCMCASCGRMLPQAYHARKLHRKTASKPEAPACAYCRTAGQSGYWAPCPEDVPRRLRKLSPEIVAALRPFDVHTGGPFRAPNGYLVHADMMRFSFKRVSVQAALAALPKKERKRGEKALIYLLDSTESSYARFWRLHERFLAHRASAIERGETWRGAPVKRMPHRDHRAGVCALATSLLDHEHGGNLRALERCQKAATPSA